MTKPAPATPTATRWRRAPRRRLRHPHGPGAAPAPRCADDDDLHPRPESLDPRQCGRRRTDSSKRRRTALGGNRAPLPRVLHSRLSQSITARAKMTVGENRRGSQLLGSDVEIGATWAGIVGILELHRPVEVSLGGGFMHPSRSLHVDSHEALTEAMADFHDERFDLDSMAFDPDQRCWSGRFYR